MCMCCYNIADKNWSLDYHQLINSPEPDYKKIQELTDDFVYAAKTYGKIIIAEHCASVKTVPPIAAGGIAGGNTDRRTTWIGIAAWVTTDSDAYWYQEANT
jgi:hypothetical protein